MSYRHPDSRALVLLCLLLAPIPAAAWDLARAERRQLANGLTLLVLAEPAVPVVSVQMLYRVGARDEPAGATGLAHFLEHMAFRSTEGFPGTEVASAITDVGGEWHGYTWLDETTYYATVPAAHLDLLLRIEAERMAHLLIPAAEVEAERGAVLAEMHGYENDPAAVLKDTVVATSFLQHPYRNNTIGWPSDVERLGHDDLVAFWRRHYRPANAVLAVVGRVSTEGVAGRVNDLFGGLPGGPPTPPPRTVEPPQTGVRRVELPGDAGGDRFEIAYRAPAVTDPDYPAFLLLQQVLGGGAGLNFAQNEWGDPLRPGARLAAVAADLVTWYPPTAFPYVLTIAGPADPSLPPREMEARIEQAVARLRARPPSPDELGDARQALLDELVYDLETSEDVAHQLAYFAGLGGLEVLLDLPRRLRAVTPEDIRRVAASYLQPHQRTIGWVRGSAADGPPVPQPELSRAPDPLAPEPPVGGTPPAAPLEPPQRPHLLRLASGLPVIFQRVPLSSAAHLAVVVPTTGLEFPGAPSLAEAPWRHTTIGLRFRPHELATALAAVRAALAAARPRAAAGSQDPARRLALAFDELLGIDPLPAAAGDATLVTLVGDLAEIEALPLVEAALGDLRPRAAAPAPIALTAAAARIALDALRAQARLGYVAPAPSPAAADGPAWRLLLHILSHGYEGRLGREAISRRGLVYYVDARYLGDGRNGRVSLDMGVDPAKLEPMAAQLRQSLAELRWRPPTESELAAAKAHLLGRLVSAAQSNAEISAMLAREWIHSGRLPGDPDQAAAIARIGHDDLLRILPAFVAGTVAEVAVAPARQPPPSELATHIFTGGKVLTLAEGRPAASALAVRGDRILAIGEGAPIEALRGPRTEVVDLAGGVLAPAFVDHHVHLLNLGLSLLWAERPPEWFLDLAGLATPEAIAERLAARAARLPPGSWLLGKGWSQGAWGSAALPGHQPLTRAVPAHPVFLTRVDGHAAWLNAAGLAAAGIGASTTDPPGGTILRQPSGAPSGVLLERAAEAVGPRLPRPTDREVQAAFRLACETLAAQGVTEVFDAGFLRPPGIVDLGLDLERYLELLRQTDRATPLPLRIHLMIPAPSRLASRLLEAAPAERRLTPRIDVTHLKLFADGALGSRGAWLSHPYADDPATRGIERMSPAELRSTALAALGAGLDVATHAIGDAAVDRVLDVHEELLTSESPPDPRRLRVEHFSYASPGAFERAARLGVVLSVNPDFVAPDDAGIAMEDGRVGADRSERVYAFASMATAGARLAFGSDYFSPPLPPLATFHAAVSRRNAAGRPVEGWHPRQRLGRLAALRTLATLWPAGGGPAQRGRLETGGIADLVVLSADPLAADADALLGIEVLATYRRGRTVYRRRR